jgi:hypothetical protein
VICEVFERRVGHTMGFSIVYEQAMGHNPHFSQDLSFNLGEDIGHSDGISVDWLA